MIPKRLKLVMVNTYLPSEIEKKKEFRDTVYNFQMAGYEVYTDEHIVDYILGRRQLDIINYNAALDTLKDVIGLSDYLIVFNNPEQNFFDHQSELIEAALFYGIEVLFESEVRYDVLKSLSYGTSYPVSIPSAELIGYEFYHAYNSLYPSVLLIGDAEYIKKGNPGKWRNLVDIKNIDFSKSGLAHSILDNVNRDDKFDWMVIINNVKNTHLNWIDAGFIQLIIKDHKGFVLLQGETFEDLDKYFRTETYRKCFSERKLSNEQFIYDNWVEEFSRLIIRKEETNGNT